MSNTRTTMLGNEGIIGTTGPLCRSRRDLALVTGLLVKGTAGFDPFLSPPLPWKKEGLDRGRKLRVGVLRDDGFVRPITPIRRAMQLALEKLGHIDTLELVMLNPGGEYRRGWDLAREL
jgi:amidase